MNRAALRVPFFVAVFLLAWPATPNAAAAGAAQRSAADAGPAAERLGRIEQAMWSQAKDALPMLRTLAASDPDQRVRERSVGAIALLGGPEDRDLLLEVLADDPSPRVRRAAAEAIRVLRLPVEAGRLTAPLERDPDPYVRAECARTIGQARLALAAPVLMNRLVNDSSPNVRALAAEALALLRTPEGLALLRFAAVRDGSPLVQMFAARALADTKDPASGPVFREIFETTRDPELRVEAFRGLLRSEAPGDWTAAGLADADDRVRFLAFERWLAAAEGPRGNLATGSETLRRLEGFLSDPLPGIRDLARRFLERRGFRVRPSGLGFAIEK